MAKPSLILGAVIGYVLGARAGRGRYEQIKSGTRTLLTSKPVQNQLSSARRATKTKLAPAALDALSRSASKAGAKLRHSSNRIAAEPARDVDSTVTSTQLTDGP